MLQYRFVVACPFGAAASVGDDAAWLFNLITPHRSLQMDLTKNVPSAEEVGILTDLWGREW